MYRTSLIISMLSTFRSAPIKPWSKGERAAKKIQYWFLGIGLLFLLFCFVLAIINKNSPLPCWVKSVAITLAFLSQIFSILSLIPYVILGVCALIAWRRHMLISIVSEMIKDEKYAARLFKFKDVDLQYAKYWLETKITRNESRLKLFFGDNTAALALLGLSWTVVKELGGLAWLSTSLNEYFTSNSILNTIIWLGLALLLGLSLGGIMVKNINEKYKYQVSLIDLAIRLKSMRQNS